MSSPRPPAGQPMGAVLLGGGSRRMRTDKAALRVDGTTLAARATDAVHRALTASDTDRPRILLVGRDRSPDPTADATSTMPDLRADAGPLAGLETALLDARRRAAAAVIVVAVDHPWMQPAVLRLMLERLDAAPEACDAVLLGTTRGPQPLIGAYRPRAADAIGALLDTGERRLLQVVDHLDVEVVTPADWRRADPSGATAVDVDTPDALEAARRWQRRVAATAGTSQPGAGRDTPRLPVIQVRGGRRRDVEDDLIAEEPLQILAAGPGQQPVPLVTTVRTPGHEHELAVGWLLAEGFADPRDVVEVTFGDAVALARPDDTVIVSLRVPVDPTAIEHRHAMATASCGICGRASIAALTDRLAPLHPTAADPSPLAWDVLSRLPGELRLAQPRFATTGGVHAAGLFEHSGRVVTVREDVGRHNALDAVIGAQALGGVWPTDGLHDLVGVLSGRIGFELVAKAAAARLPILVAVGAASDLAVRTAEALGITLVGFVRDGDGTVYTHPERLLLPGHTPGR
jgi:FdhD protein